MSSRPGQINCSVKWFFRFTFDMLGTSGFPMRLVFCCFGLSRLFTISHQLTWSTSLNCSPIDRYIAKSTCEVNSKHNQTHLNTSPEGKNHSGLFNIPDINKPPHFEPRSSQNQRNGMWVQVWVPLPDSTTTTTTEHTATSNMVFDEFTTPFLSRGNANPDFIPELSNSTESFIPSPYKPSPQAALDSSFTLDDLANDPLLFPSPLNIPFDGDLDLSLGLSIEEDMGGPAPDRALTESNCFDQFVDWNLNTSSTSPSTTAFDSFSPSTTSSQTLAIPSLPTPTFLSSTLPFPPLQSVSPPPARPAAPTPYRCSTCSKVYFKRCELTKHKRKHIKPHRCQICDFGSAELRGLQRHMWTSHREVAEQNGIPKQIAKCSHPGCSYEGRLDNLMRHMKRHEKAKTKRAARR